MGHTSDLPADTVQPLGSVKMPITPGLQEIMLSSHPDSLYLSGAKAPPSGESTGRQQKSPLSGWGSGTSQMPTFFQVSPGTYDTYRKISRDPTIALVMSIVKAPILANFYNYEKHDEETDDEWIDFARDVIDPLRHDAVRDCLHALEMGPAFFEKIWELTSWRAPKKKKDGALKKSSDTPAANTDPGSGLGDDGGKPTWVIKRLKPLLPDCTELLEGEKGVTGLRNKVPGREIVDLPIEKCLIYINDPQPGFPYGISRHENVRQRWGEKEQLGQRLAQYMRKVSGIIVQLHMPEGTSKNASGADYPNQWIGQQILDAVAAGYSVMMTNMCSLADPTRDPQLAAALAGKSSWQLSTISTEGTDYAPGMVKVQEYYDQLLFMGWLRPARTGLESQHGSRADAKAHTDTGILDSEQIDLDIAIAIQTQVLDEMLVKKYGERARGKVKIVPAPINDLAQQMLTDFFKSALANAALGPVVAAQLDWRASLDLLGAPLVPESVGEENVDVLRGALQPGQPAKSVKAPAAAANGNGNANGNGSGKANLSATRPRHRLTFEQTVDVLRKSGFEDDWIERRLGRVA